MQVGTQNASVTGTLFWQPKPGGGIPTGALIGLVVLAVAGLAAVFVVRRRRGELDEPARAPAARTRGRRPGERPRAARPRRSSSRPSARSRSRPRPRWPTPRSRARRPERGADVKTAPRAVTFRFDEPVEGNFGAVRVFDAKGRRVDDNKVVHPGGRGPQVSVGLKPGLADGTYTATYRVISADSHPVSGGVVFSVGKPGTGPAATVSDLLSGSSAGPGDRDRVRRRARRRLPRDRAAARRPRVPAAELAAGARARRRARAAAGRRPRPRSPPARGGCSTVAVVLGVALRAGRASSSRARPRAARASGRRSTRASCARSSGRASGGSGACASSSGSCSGRSSRPARARARSRCCGPPRSAPTASPRRRSPSAGVLAALAIPAAFLAITPALAGHATTQSPVVALFPLDVVHVLAMSVWIGGLVALLFVVPAATRRLDPPERSRLLAAVLRALLADGARVRRRARRDRRASRRSSTWAGRCRRSRTRRSAARCSSRSRCSRARRPRRGQPPARRARACGAWPTAASRPARPAACCGAPCAARSRCVVVVLGVTSALVSYAPPGRDRERPGVARRRGWGRSSSRRRSTPRASAPTRCTSTCSTRRAARRTRRPRS